MSRRAGLLLLALVGVAAVFGCQRATRYPAAAVKPAAVEDKAAALPTWSWQLPQSSPETADIPIVFIAHGHKDWEGLRSYWNMSPPPAAGSRTIHLGQAPFAIAGAMALTGHLDTVRIKVPLGLPDPTPHIPPANPPTLAKWKLGRQIFFLRKLVSGSDTFACASCHQPQFGFGEDRSVTLGGTRNTPSLVNAAFNRHQFWDGRVATLEEVLVRSFDDELAADRRTPGAAPQESHRWGGLVRVLEADIDYRLRFQQVFGIKQPTQDAVAKALATYVRTILSGHALVDRAEAERRRAKAPELSAEHFAAQLDAQALEALQAVAESKDALAKKLEKGSRLFHIKGCAACHGGPLYTDHDFHNIGIGDSEPFRLSGQETGRFAQVPVGLKEARLIGAYRTPTLRGLSRTAPYFHDGSSPDLRHVVEYFNKDVRGSRDYLAKELQPDGLGRGEALELNADDVAALAAFLRALDGDPVDGTVAAPPK